MKKENDIFSVGDREAHRVEFRTKLLVIFLVILVMSSGFLFYANMPMFYYGALGLGVGIILLMMYIFYFLTSGTPQLFTGDGGEESIDLAQRSGLEKVFEAEQKFKKREKISAKTKSKSRPSKKFKIGSVPMEETSWHEKYEVKKQVHHGDKDEIKKPNKVTTFLCPECGSKELYYEAGLISGYKYHCKDCDYIGSFVIEKDFKVD